MRCFDPKKKRTISLGTRNYLLNDKFYLEDFTAWDETIRDWLADRENITLQPEHHFVIEILRSIYKQKGFHPVIRHITPELKKKFGTDKGTVKYFHTLYPGGIHQAFLIAGIPMQDSCC